MDKYTSEVYETFIIIVYSLIIVGGIFFFSFRKYYNTTATYRYGVMPHVLWVVPYCPVECSMSCAILKP